MIDLGARHALMVATLAATVAAALAVGVLALHLDTALALTSVAEATLLDDRAYATALRFALGQALVATAAGLAYGLPASWVLSRGGVPLRWLLTLLVIAPLAVPGVVLGLGVDLVAAGRVASEVTVTAAHAIVATAIVAWLVTPAWHAGDPRAGEAARLLGASRWRAYLVGPGRALPSAVRAGAALAFLYAFAAVGSVLVLHGNGTTETTLVLGHPTAGQTAADDDAFRSTVALVQVAVGLVVLVVGGVRWPRARVPRPATNRWVATLGVAYVLALAVVMWWPAGSVVREAIERDTLRHVLDASVVGHDGAFLLRWTVVLGALAALLATALAWPASALLRRPAPSRTARMLSWLAVVPVALTAGVVGVAGVLLAERAGIDLDRTYALTVGAHALFAYPLAVRLLGALPDDGARTVEASLLLGEGARRAWWRWRGRRLLAALGSAALVSLVLSAGEVGAAWLLTPGEATPAALGILRAATSASPAPAEAYALGAVLTAGAVVAFGCAEWLRRVAAGGLR